MSLRVEALSGAALQAALPDLARLRIEVFRAFPYLYEGSLDYERSYLSHFAASEGAALIAALDGAEIVGVSTAAPLASQAEETIAPFRARGMDVGRIFYFGESVLRAGYRGRGIGVSFFELREAAARKAGATLASFCAVARPETHPARPADHAPLDAFGRRRGFAKVDGMIGAFSWREVGDAGESDHAMQFWSKRLT